jgi:environmental stress-induced protein Ves
MIVAMIIISAICLYLAFIMMKNSALRSILVTIFGLALMGSMFLVYANDHSHFGMEKVTTTKTSTIYSASPSKALPLLLKQNIGTNGDYQVYIYKADPAHKATHTKADYDVHNQVKVTTAKNATLTTKKTVWRYKNSFYKTLFMNQNNNHLIKQVNTIKMPNTWTELTTTQAKALTKQLKALKNPSAKVKAQMATAIQQAVIAAKMKNPAMTATQQKQVIAQAKAKLQAQMIAKAIKQVKATVK